MPSQRFGIFDHVGLRNRLAIAFMVGAAFISTTLTVTAVSFSRTTQLRQRELNLVASVQANAQRLEQREPNTDFASVIDGLPAASNPTLILANPDGGSAITVSASPEFGADQLPAELVDQVRDGTPSAMRFESEAGPLLAVGMPVASLDGALFETRELDDIESSVSGLTLRMGIAALITTAIGFFLGRLATRRLLAPLTTMTDFVHEVASGRLESRIDEGSWRDDPDLRPLVESFNEMVSALQDRIDRDARFASDVSHELRSPLTTFKASLQVLQNAKDDMPERAQIALDLLNSDMDRFSQLVEDLLEISRFDAGAVRVELDSVPIVQSVQAAVSMWTEPPLPVNAEPDLTSVVIRCDKRRVVRVLANFVDNARKYGGGATDVTVERRHARADDLPPRAGVTVDEEDGTIATIAILVGDRGPGIPPEQRGKIFDRFNRGGLGGSRGTDLGVGLGLALAAEHAAVQGGRVYVEDRPDGDHGAEFVLELPLVIPTDSADDEWDLSDVTAEHQAITIEP